MTPPFFSRRFDDHYPVRVFLYLLLGLSNIVFTKFSATIPSILSASLPWVVIILIISELAKYRTFPSGPKTFVLLFSLSLAGLWLRQFPLPPQFINPMLLTCMILSLAFSLGQGLARKLPLGIPPVGVIALLGSLYLFVFTYLPHLKFRGYYSNWMDLGYYLHPLWNTIQGVPLEMALIAGGYGSQWADHASPILYLLALPFAILPSPATLYFIATASVLMAAYYLFRLGELLWSGDGNIVGVIVLAFLLNFTVHYGLLYDFHSDVLAGGFILGFLYYMHLGRNFPALLFFLLALSTKEHISLGLIPLLIWFIRVKPERIRFHALLLCLAAGYFLVSMIWIIPHFNQGKASEALGTLYNMGGEPASLMAMVNYILFNPLKVLEQVWTFRNWENALFLLAPLLFIPILRPAYLFVLSLFLFKELYGDFYLHNHHWVAPMALMFYLIVIHMKNFSTEKRAKTALSMLFATLMFGVVCGESPLSLRFWKVKEERYSVSAKAEKLAAAVRSVPAGAPVIAQGHTALHLTNRRDLQLFPHGLSPSFGGYLLLDTNYREHYSHIQDAAYKGLSDTVYFEEVFRLAREGACEIIVENSPVFLYSCAGKR